jgi:hypothetical protein
VGGDRCSCALVDEFLAVSKPILADVCMNREVCVLEDPLALRDESMPPAHLNDGC